MNLREKVEKIAATHDTHRAHKDCCRIIARQAARLALEHAVEVCKVQQDKWPKGGFGDAICAENIAAIRAEAKTLGADATTRLAALNDYDNTVAGKLRQQLNEMQAIRSAAQADTKSAPSTCWLIERGQKEFHTPTIWYAGKSSHPDDARYNGRWTENANRAIRFSTQSECEATVYNEFMRYWGDKRVNCHASEHVFLSQELTYSAAITAERTRCAAIARAHGAEDVAAEIEHSN